MTLHQRIPDTTGVLRFIHPKQGVSKLTRGLEWVCQLWVPSDIAKRDEELVASVFGQKLVDV